MLSLLTLLYSSLLYNLFKLGLQIFYNVLVCECLCECMDECQYL